MFLKKSDFITLLIILLFFNSAEIFKSYVFDNYTLQFKTEKNTVLFDNNIYIFLSDEKALSQVPGIGKVLCAKIADYVKQNNTGNFLDLSLISGIGTKKIQNIKNFYEKNY